MIIILSCMCQASRGPPLLRQAGLPQTVGEEGGVFRAVESGAMRRAWRAAAWDRACARRSMARRASSMRPASAQLAAMTAADSTKIGTSRNDFSAHAQASSKRLAMRCAIATPACMRNISESSGLRRMACSNRLIASSGSPRQILKIAAQEPRGREIGVEHERLVEKVDPGIEVAGEVRERMTAARERDSVVLAEVDGASAPGARPPRCLGRGRRSSR